MADLQMFPLGDVVLQSGATLWQARIAYTTYGALNAARDNVVVIPTFYAGHHTDVEPMMSAGRAIDPAKYFIVVPNMLGNDVAVRGHQRHARFQRRFRVGAESDRRACDRDAGRRRSVFPRSRCELEAAQMPNAELRPIPSTWGHAAGRGTNPPDNQF